jgi:hypothetical protein
MDDKLDLFAALLRAKGLDPNAFTFSIVEAGRALELGRDASYEAAKRGSLPTVEFGPRSKRVTRGTLQRLAGL